jgi:hypothetical protein
MTDAELIARLRSKRQKGNRFDSLEYEAADRIEALTAKLAAIDDLMVRRIKHHQEMKGLKGSGMAMKREHYKLHVLSETLGEIRKVTKARATLAEIKGESHE